MRLIARVLLPLLLLAYIGTETYMKLQHTSLCGEVGCKLAGELLNFNPIYLNYFGMAGVFVLMLLGIVSLRNQRYEKLFFMALYSAIAFEATILSYQFVANPEPCLFCLGIFASLLLIALASELKRFGVTLSIALAVFAAMHILAISKNQAFMMQEGNYLIQSESCPHCKKAKAYLTEHNISYTPISTQEASARNFLKFAGVGSIPVLIIKEKHQHKLIVGDVNIIAHFEAQDRTSELSTQTPSSNAIPSSREELGIGGLSQDFLAAGGDEGCAISIVETPTCSESNTTEERE